MPDVFHVLDAFDTASDWKLTKQNVTPHTQAYVETLDINTTKSTQFYESIVNTR